jgi:hypothetical protein
MRGQSPHSGSIRRGLFLMARRKTELEHKLASTPNESKEREIRKHHRLESQHLRLKRTKIKLEDFRTVKIIGKGAFGEVRHRDSTDLTRN